MGLAALEAESETGRRPSSAVPGIRTGTPEVGSSGGTSSLESSHQSKDLPTHRQIQLWYTFFCLVNLLLISIFDVVRHTNLEIGVVQWSIFSLGVIGLYLCCSKLFSKAVKEMTSLRPAAASLLAIGLAIYAGLVLTHLTFAQESMVGALFFEGFLMAVLLAGGIEYYENFLARRIRSSFYFVPEKPVNRVKSVEEDSLDSPNFLPLEAINDETLLLFEEGDHLPFDLKVVSGDALVEERKNSGVAFLRRFGQGVEVGAGSRIVKGRLVGNAIGKFCDTNMSQFWQQVEEVYCDAARDQSSAHRSFLPLMLVFLAASGFLLQYELSGEILYSLLLSVAILFLAPLLFVSELKDRCILLLYVKAFHRGLLVRGGRVLDKVAVLKSLFLHFDEQKLLVPPRVVRYELLDNRFDADAVLSVMLSMAGLSADYRAEVLTRFCLNENQELSLQKTGEYGCFDGMGIFALIQGADFTLGTEEFLIERGVQFSANEVLSDTEKEFCWYLACNEDPIAIVRFEKGIFEEFSKGFETLRDNGVRGFLWSDSMPSQRADAAGKAIGLELSQVVCETDLEKVARRLGQSRPNAFICEDYLRPELGSSIDIWCSAFDDFRWNYESGDILLLGSSLSDFASSIKSIKKTLALAARSWTLLSVASILGLASVFLFGLSPVLSLLVCAIVFSSFCGYMYRTATH